MPFAMEFATIVFPQRIELSGSAWLPWARCNLTRNPFGELTSEERAEVAIVDVDSIASKLKRRLSAVQFVGDCGRGKTTRMLVLAKRLAGSSYVYLPENGPTPAIAQGNPLLIDEAQRLPREIRRRIFSTGIALVLATHRDLSRPLRRHGYTVHTEPIGKGNTPELVEQLLNRRIEASRLGEGPVPTISIEDSEQLVRRFGSDIRQIEHYLYEQIQTHVTQNPMTQNPMTQNPVTQNPVTDDGEV